MSGVNKAIILGNLGKDPEIRTMQNGNRVCNLSIATSESWNDKQSGERKEKTEWHRVVIFDDKLVEVAEKYAKKGSKVYIEGQIQTRKWTDQSGAEKYSTEIVLQKFRGVLQLLDRRPADENDGDHGHGEEAPKPGQRTHATGRGTGGMSDDGDPIPF